MIEMQQSNQSELEDIIFNCHISNAQSKSIMSSMHTRHEKGRIRDSQTLVVQQKLSDLEGIAPEFLKHVLNYQEGILKKEVKEAREATIEFKQESMDPTRPIIQWE
jgi:hypothetical protein